MAKDKGQKKKDREKKVFQKKQAEALLRSAAAKEEGTAKTTNVPRPNALTKGIGNQTKGSQAGVTKQFSHRRMGGGG